MKNSGIALAALAVLLFVGASADAISSGPGGRMYFAGRAGSPPADCSVLLRSVVFNADWTLSGWETQGAPIANHRDDWNVTWGPGDARFMPQIEVNRGKGYSDIVMGLWHNNTPASAVSLPGTPWGDFFGETMDILSIATGPGSRTISLIGDGRAANSAGSTDLGRIAINDPKKTFVGPAGGYIVEGFRANDVWNMGTFIAHDAAPPDGDATDDDADYSLLYADHVTMGVPSIQEAYVLGEHIFAIGSWVGIVRFDRQTVAQGYRAGAQWCDISVYGAWPASHLAMATINGHDAGFWLTHYGAGAAHLILSIDKNDDNEALDAGETIDIGTVSDGGTAFPNVNLYRDLEYIEGKDGKRFVVGLNSGLDTMTVIELYDNLAAAGSTTLSLGSNLNNGTWSLSAMRFANEAFAEAPAIPEPTTLLLVGTGTLGALGWVRRRRMA